MTTLPLPGLAAPTQRRRRHVHPVVAWERTAKSIGLRMRPRPTSCPLCDAPVLAFRLRLFPYGVRAVDAAPITSAAEIAAVIADEETFEIDGEGFMDDRSRWAISERPADTHAVYIAHSCGVARGINFDTMPAPKKSAIVSTETDQVPF